MSHLLEREIDELCWHFVIHVKFVRFWTFVLHEHHLLFRVWQERRCVPPLDSPSRLSQRQGQVRSRQTGSHHQWKGYPLLEAGADHGELLRQFVRGLLERFPNVTKKL